jgi:hypothetical protein
MKPGDLLQPRRWNIYYGTSINYLDVWNRPDGTDDWQGKWEHGQVGVLLEGRYASGDIDIDPTVVIMIEVLLEGRKCWAVEDEVEVLK